MFLDSDHESLVELQDWLDTLSEVDRELVEEEIEDLLEAASRGRIPKPVYENLVRVGIDPMFLELRWLFRGLGKRSKDVPVRQYHAEPTELPDALVALHRHIKKWKGLTKAQRDELQETEMRYAKFRYIAGKSSQWE